jgi:hypothetical protein
MEKKMCFLGEGLGLGQDPGLLDFGFKIPDHTIDQRSIVPSFSALGAIAAEK